MSHFMSSKEIWSKNRAHWVTRREGGHGAVREICDLILAARGLDQRVLDGILDQ